MITWLEPVTLAIICKGQRCSLFLITELITFILFYRVQINRFAKNKLRVIFLEVFSLGILKCLYVVGDTGLEPVTLAL